jgi:hypothetical protein
MANTVQIGRTDNDFGAVTPVGTTDATTAVLVNGINTATAAAGNTAVKLPTGAAGPIVVRNTAASAVTLLVFPPTGGSINGGTVSTGSYSVAQNARAVFFPHPNGLDFTAITSA